VSSPAFVTTGIEIRKAVPADVDQMARFTECLAAERVDTLLQTHGVSSDKWRQVLVEFAENGRAFSLLAVTGDEVVGMLDLKAGKWPAIRHTATLSVSVLQAWRGRGIGRALLSMALAETRGWTGFCRLELEVVPWNEAAIALYQSHGFQIEGVKKGAVPLRGRREDLLTMAVTW
jgi:ribosomal protein S18 acetylase RimI-like enzyme